MNEPSINLPAYLHRIGYTGTPEPNLANLRNLHFAHATSIPFENVDSLLGLPVRLDLPSLERKLIHERRGGYCFEHNLLFSHALRACGFNVTGLAARVVWMQSPDAMTPKTHMLLRVDIAGESYLADVGFGGMTLTSPLQFKPGTEQSTTHEPFRLTEFGSELLMEALVRNDWLPLYRFELTEHHLPDYEVANWFISTHPESFFTFDLIAARPEPDRRFALRGNSFAIHHLNSPTERRTLETVTELRRVLEDEFLIPLPNHADLNNTLNRIIESATDAEPLRPAE